MDTLIRFKNRETTAKHGRLPDELLIFADLSMKKDELDLVYEAVKYEIGKCAKIERYDIVEIYINLMIDIEDIYEEIKKKYKNLQEYIFIVPIHILELNYLYKALKDYEIKLDKVKISDTDNVSKISLLVKKTELLTKHNYKILKEIAINYDKAQRRELLKNIWNKLYELTGAD
jgi:membrane-associated HD superfamily phosphohydrolase